MFKKVLLMFAFCMCIFGVGASASTLAPNDISYTYSYKISNYESTGRYMYYYSNTPLVFVVESGYLKRTSTGSGVYYSYSSADVLLGNNSFSGASSVLSITSDYVPIINDVSVVDTVPPLQSPTVQQALGNLMTAFGASSMILLGVGVAILALLLGVSLVPRLVRLFL